MEINNNTIVNVCNYMPCPIIVTSNVQDYRFDGCENSDMPIVIPISAVELRNINSKSHIFSDGYLTFEDEYKKDVYEYLKISDWENILTQEDIIDTILHCTKDKLQKIIDINSISYFERVRGIYIALKQQKADISLRVVDVIEARYKELLNGKFKTSIELRDANFKSDNEHNSTKDEQIAKMEEQIKNKDLALKEMQEKMAKLEQMISQLPNTVAMDNAQEVDEKPKRGRPSTKNK